jgi:DNA-binding beta-propeller fold protein YncE
MNIRTQQTHLRRGLASVLVPLTFGVRAVTRLTLALLIVGAVVSPGSVAADAVAPSAPENLRCPGRPAPAVPEPGWTVTPVWAWQNLVQVPGDIGTSDGPYAIALDHECNVYVTDSQHFSVLKLAPDGHQIGQWSLPGQRSPGESSSPRGVAVDSQGYVYVTDTSRDRVYKVSPQGQLTGTWGDCPNGGSACDPKLPGRFIGPQGIAVDGAGNVYVAEVAGKRLQKLSSSGKSLAVWNLADKALGDQLIPGSLSVDQGGFVYMAEAYNNWVVKFDPNSGAVAGKWGGTQGGQPGQLHGPLGVGVDAAGNMYVSDAQNWRVQELGPDGSFVTQWRNCLDGDPPCQFPGAGTDPGQFMESRGIAVDGQGTVYVADTDNKRVERLMIVDWTLTPPTDSSQP